MPKAFIAAAATATAAATACPPVLERRRATDFYNICANCCAFFGAFAS